MRTQRDYNHIYTVGRVIVQVTQDSQADGIIVRVLPTFSIAINNNKCHLAIGLEWLTGDVSFGWMRASFVEMEKQRRARVKEVATKAGLTVRQQELRWGW